MAFERSYTGETLIIIMMMEIGILRHSVERSDGMRIGFIGAGKMGFTMGKHLVDKKADVCVMGYYSRDTESARQAARFTGTKYYEKLEDLICECDAIFLTVPDGQIAYMAKTISELDEALLDEKILCHTSGALSSQVFSGMSSHVYGYSIHPMYAVSSKLESYTNFSQSYITIEGDHKFLMYFRNLFESLGHKVSVIAADKKVLYHAAAVYASNLVIALYSKATKLLTDCGFTKDEANKALKPLFMNNATKLYESSPVESLTGPVERGDIETINKHLGALDNDEREIYRLLSKELIDVAIEKNGGDIYPELLDRLN